MISGSTELPPAPDRASITQLGDPGPTIETLNARPTKGVGGTRAIVGLVEVTFNPYEVQTHM